VASSLVGRTLGNYLIQELLGQGGMATVYKGYRADIDRYVAVKVLPPHPGLDQEFIERFRQEARTIARLQHPHILPLYDYGVQDDILYLIMAYIDGGSLADRIEEGGMRLSEVEKILRQVAGALDYAHRQGVIHRDIKPDNILLDKEGNALLADFGIAKLAEGGSNLTVTGGLVGTPAYMAPEQGSGDKVTGSADIYSLGVVVYEMLTGSKPYNAETPMQIVIKHMTAPVPSIREKLPDLPAQLELVIDRALAKLPDNRYASAVEFADDFTKAIHSADSVAGMKMDFHPTPDPTLPMPTGIPTMTESSPTPPNTQTIIQQVPAYNPLLLLGGFAIIALLIVGVVFLLLNNQNTPPATAQETPLGDVTADSAATTAAGQTAQAVVAAPTETPQLTYGRLSFSTTEILGDTVTLQVNNLTPLPGGRVYAAWLLNTQDDTFLKLGTVTVDAQGTGVLPPYVDAGGRTLPALYNAIILTYESQPSDTPEGQQIAYQDELPAEILPALNQIFITSPDGLSAQAVSSSTYEGAPQAGGPTVSLLASALAEAQIASQHAGLAQRSSTIGGMHLHNEHTVNILLGTQDDYDGDGSGQNPGFGVGLPRLIDLIEAQLDTVANAPAATRRLQANLENIRVCLENARLFADQIVELEKEMLAATDITAVSQPALDSTRIATALINGVDTNGNGQVEPFEGECGLNQVTTYGLLASTMNLAKAG
jgi:serine/threonine protein kinase